MEIESYIKSGNSCPVILRDKGKRHLVKLQAGLSGRYALPNEWLGNSLGSQMGINTLAPQWFHLDDKVILGDIDIEVKDLITKSHGLNIGFEYLEDVVELNITDLNQIKKQSAIDIFLFDLMMINIDRTESNLNLIKSQGEIFCIDYDASLLIQSIIEKRDLANNPAILQCLRNNPLYQNVDNASLDRFINKTRHIKIDKVLEEIPGQLLVELDKKLLADQIKEKIKHDWHLKEVLEKLQTINPQTEEATKKRANANQAEFKRKFKENLS